MPTTESQPTPDISVSEVMTLSEVAAFLRVPEKAILERVSMDAMPAQQIGGEWRFLKRAIVDWLRLGQFYHREFQRFPPFLFPDHPVWEDMFRAMEQRILGKLPPQEKPAPKPGTKEAVLKHFGIFKDDGDLEEQLANIHAQRKAVQG